MRIGLLGPVTAGPDGAPAPGGVRLRGALARLAVDAARPVSVSTLVDDLWGAEPPDTAGNALQALVARLRRALGADVVATVPGGYRLAVDPHDVDALRFESLVATACGRDPAQARALLREYAAQRLDDAGERPAVEAAHGAAGRRAGGGRGTAAPATGPAEVGRPAAGGDRRGRLRVVCSEC